MPDHLSSPLLLSTHGLMSAVGLLVYVLMSHALRQRRHPAAAVGWVLLLAAAPLLTAQALAPTLVPDVSQRNIEIAYSFTGAELLLFGAILYPGGRTPRPCCGAALLRCKVPREAFSRAKAETLTF